MSGRNYFLRERQHRVDMFLKMIEKHGDSTPIKKIVGIFSLKTGLSHNRISQYLRELEEGGIIEYDSDRIHVKVVAV